MAHLLTDVNRDDLISNSNNRYSVLHVYECVDENQTGVNNNDSNELNVDNVSAHLNVVNRNRKKGIHDNAIVDKHDDEDISIDTDDDDDENDSVSVLRYEKGTSFAIFNIASLLGKIDEFRIFMQKNPVDVIALNETCLDSTIPDTEVYVENFDVYRNDRNRNGGGVAVYMRSDSGFTYKAREDLMPSELEVVAIEMKKCNMKPTVVIAWYRPPGSEMKLFEHIEYVLEQVEIEDKSILLLGDVNCDLLAVNPHCYTIKMNEVAENFHLKQVITKPTRVTETSESLIDHIYTSCPNNVNESDVIHTAMSDHYCAYTIIGKEKKVKSQNHKYSMNRKYKNLDENRFRSDIANVDWYNVTKYSCIDKAVSEFENIFLNIANKHAPLKRKRVRQNNSSPWLTDEILAAMRERDQLKKRASKTKSPQLWNDFRKLRNKVNGMIKESKKMYVTNGLKTKDSKEVWNNLRHIVPGKNKNTEICCIKTQEGECTDSKGIANTLNEYFADVGPSIADKIPEVEMLNNNVDENNSSNGEHFTFKGVTDEYVLEYLSSLPDKKATGVDDISSKLLKISAKEVSPIITFLVNKSLHTGIFPNKWKKARVCPIFKGGDNTDPCNYRPISILPVLSKVIERAVFDQLYPFLDSNQMLHESQSGFRPGFSTASALLDITEDWLKSIDNGEYIGIVMLDLRKAFDTVNHKLLIDKLQTYGFDDHVIRWFRSYLNERCHVTSVNGSKSSERKSVCGIPQGSILGPLLFILYINDLPKYVTNVKVSMYADDTAIYFSSKNVNDVVNRINCDLENIDNWLACNKLSLNVDKTHFMIIGTPQRLANLHDVDLNVHIKGARIQRANHCKHLGVEIDDKLIWNEQIDKVRKKVLTGLYFMKKAANFIPKQYQSMLYNCIIAPYFNYCNVVWGRCNKTLCNKLQVLQNRAAKIITGVSRYGSSTEALNVLNWKNLEEKLSVSEAVVMYKIVNNQAPSYLSNRFSKRETCYNTRHKHDLFMQKPNTEYMKRSFTYRGAKLWNSLDDNVKNACNPISFKQLLN